MLKLCGLLAVAIGAASIAAGQVPVTVRVSSETAPPGGIAQMKILMTVPKPLTGGVADFTFDPTVFDSAVGIALFTASPDVAGAATVTPGGVQLRFTSPAGTYGMDTDYPIMAIALPVRPGATLGSKTRVSLDQAGTWLIDLFGTFPLELKAGTMTVGGSINITNVIPGDTAATVLGLGFTPSTRVKVDGNDVPFQWISPNQMLVFADLVGHELLVKNPDGSQDTYDTYVRAIPQGVSNNPLLAATVPVFSRATASSAVLPVVAGGGVFTGVAIQNPSPTLPAPVKLTYVDAQQNEIAKASVLVAPYSRITNDVFELLPGVTPQAGGSLQISSPRSVQVIGLQGDQTSATVTPFAPVILAP